MRRHQLPAFFLLLALLVSASAKEAQPKVSRDQMVSRAIAYLTSAQDEQGALSPQVGPAVTALAATGMLANGRSVTDPAVAKAIEYVRSFAREDGGIYQDNSLYKNYETCLAMQMFAAANAEHQYDDVIAAGEKFLKELQWDEGEEHDISSMNYGGAGYGNHKRPDLSNTAFLIDALHELGAGADDPAIQRALVFVSRSQNLESEHNTTPFAAKVNDGGFYYTPAAGGSSQAGGDAATGLRSYGSMTYAGLKSMIYAGVKADDPRVQAAKSWLAKHYTLTENPGMGQQGLYYYYHTLAKSLDAVGEPEFTDAAGANHAWRDDLLAQLAKTQQPNGSWVNPNDRWLEGDPNLVTAYVLLALAHCEK
jgi:squalene-hopene/tetraprenyl-beta-curcumene cyclase